MDSGTPLLHPAAADEPAAREGRLGTFGAAAMLTCWSTASCNLLYPWLYGVAGVVSGPALQLAMQFLTTWVAVRMCDAARRVGARTCAELGLRLAGPRGELALEAAQVGNQLLWLPVAICLVTDALQCVVPAWSCNVHVALGCLVVGFVLINVAREYTPETAGFAAFSVALILVQSGIIIYWAFSSRTGASDAPWGYWRGPPAVTTWANWAYVLALNMYAWCPSFIVVEVMREMREPARVTAALWWSCAATYAIYLATGVSVVVAWGAELDLPITLALGTDTWASIATNLMLIGSTLIDFVISATIVNQFVQRRWLLATPDAAAGVVEFAAVTLPTMALTSALVIFVPKLESLTSIVAAFTNTVAEYVGPAGCLLAAARRSGAKDGDAVSPGTSAALVAVVLLGIGLMVLIAAEAVYTIGWQTSYRGNFWCDVAG